jgi:hypothetical protein
MQFSISNTQWPRVSMFRRGVGASRRRAVPNLHGLEDRLRAVGLWAHGDVHPVRQKDERVPHLPPVRRQGRSRVPYLKNALCHLIISNFFD